MYRLFINLNPYKHSVLFTGHWQTVQTQIKMRRLHILLSECSKKFELNEKYHTININELVQLIRPANQFGFNGLNIAFLFSLN